MFRLKFHFEGRAGLTLLNTRLGTNGLSVNVNYARIAINNSGKFRIPCKCFFTVRTYRHNHNRYIQFLFQETDIIAQRGR